MSYVQESLAPGEKILKISRYHWMYLVSSAISSIFFILMSIAVMIIGIVYHYFDIVKVPPWMFFKAAAELSFSDYTRAFWFTNILVRVGAFGLILMSFLTFGVALLVRTATEIAVTNRRVVLKRGLVSRRVEEMRVDLLEGADVNQTIMGRIFGYGQIKAYGSGTENIFFPRYTEDAIGFRRAINAARMMNPPTIFSGNAAQPAPSVAPPIQAPNAPPPYGTPPGYPGSPPPFPPEQFAGQATYAPPPPYVQAAPEPLQEAGSNPAPAAGNDYYEPPPPGPR